MELLPVTQEMEAQFIHQISQIKEIPDNVKKGLISERQARIAQIEAFHRKMLLSMKKPVKYTVHIPLFGDVDFTLDKSVLNYSF